MIDERSWRKSSYSGAQAECVEVGTWRKASYSGTAELNCVEVADVTDLILVRDTTTRAGGTLEVSAAAWRAFTGGLQ